MNTSEKKFALNEAMTEKKAVRFSYREELELRNGNPHAMGFGIQDSDHVYVRLYQTSGPSSSGLLSEDPEGANFRLFGLADIDNIEILTEEFEPHPAFKCCDSAIDWKRFPNKQVDEDCTC